MRKIKNTLYVQSPDILLGVSGENIVVKRNGQEVGRYPFHLIGDIVSFSHQGATPELMGEAAKVYFDALGDKVRVDEEAFVLRGRSRRPPRDPMNAMLSFGYVLLTSNCASALESVGLDSYVGMLHEDRSGRASLACDLVEELRACMVDRFVISLVNNRVIKPVHFEAKAGGVYLTPAGRALFLTKWQKFRREQIMYLQCQERVEWGMIPLLQARELASVIRGESETYRPFIWR